MSTQYRADQRNDRRRVDLDDDTREHANAQRVRYEQDLRDESLVDLVKRLADEAQTLVRLEVELAKTEVTEKVQSATSETKDFVQNEVSKSTSRIKEEVSANAKKAGVAIGLYVGAGVLGMFAFGVLTYALVWALALVLPVWGAALVVAITYAVIAGILAALAKKRLDDALPLLEPETIEQEKQHLTSVAQRSKDRMQEAVPPVPDQTIETLKEDVEWAKKQPRSGKR